MTDILGNLLRTTPPFRGKWRLQRIWERSQTGEHRTAILPDGSCVNVQMDIPYERMVWLQVEEWDELLYLGHKLREGDLFIDVGANIGLWTLVAASAVGSQGRVLGFEPNPTTYAKLLANIALNNRNAIVGAFQNAVSKGEGTVWFACEPQHNLSAIISNPNHPSALEVRTVSLDSLLSRYPRNRFAGMKLDTEGHELPALQGASRLIEEFTPWIIVEFNTTLLQSKVLQDWTVYKYLTERGYRAFIYYGSGQETQIDGALSVRGYRNILFQLADRRLTYTGLSEFPL